MHTTAWQPFRTCLEARSALFENIEVFYNRQRRRLEKEYERLCSTSEAFIYLARIRLMLRRLARF